MEGQIHDRNHSVDIFRYIAAVLIIAHHTDVLADIHPMLSYLISQVLPRIGVPFFCSVAGYYYSSRLVSGSGGYWNYIKRLLQTYTLWSAVYIVSDYLLSGSFELKQVLLNYFFFGSAYHFWYFPALILSVSVFTAMYRIGLQKILVPVSLLLYLIGCLGHAYYRIGAEIPGLSVLFQVSNWRHISHVFTLAFPSFILGYILLLTQKHWQSFHFSTVTVIAVLAVFLGEIFLMKILDFARTTTQSIGLYMLVYALLVFLFLHPLPSGAAAGRACRVLANAAYYSHVLFISAFNEINAAYWAGRMTYTVKFLFVFILSLALGVLLYRSKGRTAKAFAA